MGVNSKMPAKARRFQPFFESTEVATAVGIQPILLNKFLERHKYGIQASVRSGIGRGRRRNFSEDDVFGIALVWWLFESGLRTKVIQFVLNQICRGKLNSRANDAARILVERETELLVVEREPRTGAEQGAEHPEQRVRLMDADRITSEIKVLETGSLLVLPVGHLYARLKTEMHRLQSGE
jgi:hypothetical protein